MFVTGFAQMAACNAIAPWMIELVGGRQTARTLHVFISLLLVIFVCVHLIQVFRNGILKKLRGITIGNFSKRQKHKRRECDMKKTLSRRNLILGAGAVSTGVALTAIDKEIFFHLNSVVVLWVWQMF